MRPALLAGGAALLACCATEKPADATEQAAVQSVLVQHRAQFTACGKEGREHEPNRHGKLVLRLVVSPDGDVEHLTAIEDGDSTFAQCVLAFVKDQTFPGVAGETVVYPVKF